MKYWLFDGEDVVGPFTPQEITARAGFSDSILVCPETQSEDEHAWQMASTFEDFLPKGNKKEPAKDTKKPSAKKSPAPTTKVPLTITSVPISHAENEEPVLSIKTTQEDTQKESPVKEQAVSAAQQPVAEPTVSQKDTVSQAPVQDKVASKEEPTESSAPKQEAPTNQGEQTATPTTDKPLSENKTDPGLWPELSLHSLPVLGVSENTLPPLPPGDITLYVPSTEPAIWDQPQDIALPESTPRVQESVAPKSNPVKESSVAKETAPQQKEAPISQNTPAQAATPAKTTPVRKQPAPLQKKPTTKTPTAKRKRVAIPAPLPAEIPEDAPEDFFAQTLSPFTQIPRELVQAQDEEAIARIIQNPVPAPIEPDDFIPQKPSSSGGARFLLFAGIFLMFILLLIIAGYWLAHARRANRTAMSSVSSTVQTTLPEGESFPLSVTPAKTSARETRPNISVPPPAVNISPLQEKALDSVKNYTLSNGRGTVEKYLNKLYTLQLSQGYEASWSAEPLHKSTYIVKYRLTKTRTEPVVYVFQVDTATGKLTGALNNITLDLVGKI